MSIDIVNYGEGKFNKESKIQENFYVPPVYEIGCGVTLIQIRCT